jgi:hypothetical protein
MTVGANSYCTAADVGALTPRYLATGVFSTTTRPTLAQVEAWIDQVSGVLNLALSTVGFTVPITQADALLACKGVVAGFVADLAHYSNSAGRFYSEKVLDKGVSPWSALYSEMADWVKAMQSGFIKLGVVWTSVTQSATVSCTVTNPTYEREPVDAVTTNDEIGVLVT